MSNPLRTQRVSEASGTSLSDRITSLQSDIDSNNPKLIIIDAQYARMSNESLPATVTGETRLDLRVTTPTVNRMGSAIIDFGPSGADEDTTASVTVSATWVQANSIIVCQASGIATSDHDPEDAVVENTGFRALNIVPSVSFDIEGYAPNGTWGQYQVNYSGVLRGAGL